MWRAAQGELHPLSSLARTPQEPVCFLDASARCLPDGPALKMLPLSPAYLLDVLEDLCGCPLPRTSEAFHPQQRRPGRV
jgi:hypothetical protein